MNDRFVIRAIKRVDEKDALFAEFHSRLRGFRRCHGATANGVLCAMNEPGRARNPTLPEHLRKIGQVALLFALSVGKSVMGESLKSLSDEGKIFLGIRGESRQGSGCSMIGGLGGVFFLMTQPFASSATSPADQLPE